MAQTTSDPVADIRAAQAEAARRAAEHDQPRLARMAELLEQMRPLTDELAVVVGEVVTPYLVAPARGLGISRQSLADAVAGGQRAVEAALSPATEA